MRLIRSIFFIAINLLAVDATYAASRLNGIWTVNLAKSDFGGSSVPQQVIVRLEQSADQIVICTVTSDDSGQHLGYRVYDLIGKGGASSEVVSATRTSLVLRFTVVDGQKIEEDWRLTEGGALVIARLVTNKDSTISQRLILDAATVVFERARPVIEQR